MSRALCAPGNVYLTFDKTSEAVLAMEELNGKTLADHPKQLKVSGVTPEWLHAHVVNNDTSDISGF